MTTVLTGPCISTGLNVNTPIFAKSSPHSQVITPAHECYLPSSKCLTVIPWALQMYTWSEEEGNKMFLVSIIRVLSYTTVWWVYFHDSEIFAHWQNFNCQIFPRCNCIFTSQTFSYVEILSTILSGRLRRPQNVSTLRGSMQKYCHNSRT